MQELLDRFHVGIADIPVLICRGELVLRNPTNARRSPSCLGFNDAIDRTHVRDLVIVGAGPSGLAAAVYGASEGLDVLALEIERAGRAGGLELADRELPRVSRPGSRDRSWPARAYTQAQKFGAQIMIANGAHRAHLQPKAVRAADRRRRHGARRAAIIIATGAEYRRPALDNLCAVRRRRRLLRRHVRRGAALRRRGSHRRRRRQLRRPGRGVPGPDGRARPHARPSRRPGRHDVALPDPPHRGEPEDHAAHPTPRSSRLEGNEQLERVRWRDNRDGRVETRAVRHVFMMIGRGAEHGMARRAASRSTRKGSSRPDRI